MGGLRRQKRHQSPCGEQRGIHQPLCTQRGDRKIRAAVPGLMDEDNPDDILGQVAFAGCCAKPAELSRPTAAAWVSKD